MNLTPLTFAMYDRLIQRCHFILLDTVNPGQQLRKQFSKTLIKQNS
jgi:pentose-5-phosphate-3-epimerase